MFEQSSPRNSLDCPDRMVNNARREALQVATYVTIIMAFVFVALRMTSRIFITRHTTWDDYMMVFAFFIALGLSLTVLLAAQKGFGLMDVDLKPGSIPDLKRFGYAFSILYVRISADSRNRVVVYEGKSELTINRTHPLWPPRRASSYSTYGFRERINCSGLAHTQHWEW